MLSKEIIDDIGFIKITPGGKISTTKYGLLTIDKLRSLLIEMDVVIKASQSDELVEYIRSLTTRKVTIEKSPDIDDALAEETERLIQEVTPVVDIFTGELSFFHTATRNTLNIHPKVYAAKKGISDRDVMTVATPGIIDFFPLTPEAIFAKAHDTGRIHAFNRYRTPKWVGSIASDPENIPTRLKTLLENVFPDPATLEYVLCWIFHAVADRNRVYLCMVGPRGVGKTMVADLIGQLVGVSYYQKVDDSILEDKFNSQLDNARLAFYDEISVNDPEKINKLKRFANETTSVQAKGKDAKTIRNYASGILANNYIDGLQIGPEERRFSIVEIGDKDLRNVMPQEEIEIMAKYLNASADDDPHEDIVNFGHWLLRNHFPEPKYNNSHTWRGEYYYKVSFGGLAQWKQFLLEYLTDNPTTEIILLKTLKTEYKKYLGESKAVFPSSKTIANFLYDYRHKEGIKVGGVVKTKDSEHRVCPAIKLTDEFVEFAKKELENSGVTEDELKTMPIVTRSPTMKIAEIMEEEESQTEDEEVSPEDIL